MSKGFFKKILFLSLVIHVLFAFYYPLIADEINLWNRFYGFKHFGEFWRFFVQYETHQPLFFVPWFYLFNEKFPTIVLRLPSIVFWIASLYYWQKLFPYQLKKNVTVWILFLFSPFLTMYSVFFLPYSLLIFMSVSNYYYFQHFEKNLNNKNIFYFILSSTLLIFTHYYGALQVFLLLLYLVYSQDSFKVKRSLIGGTLFALLVFLLYSDFINDLDDFHDYRKVPNLIDLFGYLNLLIGGRLVVVLLLVAIFMKKVWINFKSREMIFILAVFLIAFLKCVFISPSMEARYLLILIYPLYYIINGALDKKTIILLILVCIFSLFLLQEKFGPMFVINFKDVEKNNHKTGLLLSPCPKYYFQEENYVCINNFPKKNELNLEVAEIITDKSTLQKYKNEFPVNKCRDLKKDLYLCKF